MPDISEAEKARLAKNAEAWKSFGTSGYETTSGCPCWDANRYICVPKHTGLGYNPNFYAIFCCWLCGGDKDAQKQ